MKISVLLFLTDILPQKRRFFNKIVKNKIFGDISTEKVFSEMKKSGIEGIEVLLPNYVTHRDLEDLKEVTSANKMKIYSVHQALRFFTKTGIPEIVELFKTARFLSADVIVLHMSSAKKQLFDKEYITEIHSMQNKYKIKVGFENSEKHIGSIRNKSAWDQNIFARLMENNDFNITLDICHLGQSGGDIIEFAKKYQDRIVNIHLSDFKPNFLNNTLRPMRYKHMVLGRGTLPISEFITTLKDEKYNGLLTMEIETDLKGLLESAAYIQKAS